MLNDLYREVCDQELSKLRELGYGAYIRANGKVQLHHLGFVNKPVGPRFENLSLALDAVTAKARSEARRGGDL